MNTPSHVVLNLALLGRRDDRGRASPIVLGAILPDLPVLFFFLSARYLYGLPGEVIWSRAYFDSAWQMGIDALHSFPLLAMGLALAHARGWRWGQLLFASMILHSLADLPLHMEDAHRHFFPFSDWRFRSPVSYWDPRHHGRIGATIELACVLAASVPLWARFRSRGARAVLLALDGAYLLLWVLLVAVPLASGGQQPAGALSPREGRARPPSPEIIESIPAR